MTKILFICHGNICRSPMAEYIFNDLAARRGLSSRFAAFSCAVSDEEIVGGIGNPVYPPAERELRRHGVPCPERRAVKLKKSDYALYDLLVVMDGGNLRRALSILGGDPEGKVCKLLRFAGSDADVSDPWYTDRFDLAYNDIEKGCVALLDALIHEKNAGFPHEKR